MSISTSVHPLLLPLYDGDHSTKNIHPLLQPLFFGKCLPSPPLTPIPNPETQPEVPALYDATNTQSSPGMKATPERILTKPKGNLNTYTSKEAFMVDMQELSFPMISCMQIGFSLRGPL